MSLTSTFVREQGTSSVPEYSKRVYKLAAAYFGIVLVGALAIGIIVYHGKHFVTLAQRSNVETLTLAVVLLLFAYLIIACFRGAVGAILIAYYNLPAWLGGDRDAVERKKQAAIRPRDGEPDYVFLNCLVRAEGASDSPIEVELQDAVGSLGKLIINGAELCHNGGPHHSSNSIFAFFEQRIQELVRKRQPGARVQIVQWATIDDQTALEYFSMVQFSQNMEKHLHSEPLWPSVELTKEDVEQLQREAAELCPSLRNEAHLPDLEYQAEHRVPIIPEPLAFISLARQEQRADPLSSMGCAFIVTVVILGFLLLFLFVPPWVPGK